MSQKDHIIGHYQPQNCDQHFRGNEIDYEDILYCVKIKIYYNKDIKLKIIL